MPRYQINDYVLVKVTSETLESEDALLAFDDYLERADLHTLLRNITGTDVVASVEYTDGRAGVKIFEVNEKGEPIREAESLDQEDLKNLYP